VSGSWEAAHVRPIGTKTYTAKCCGACRAMIVAFAHCASFALVAARGGHMQLSPTRCSSTSVSGLQSPQLSRSRRDCERQVWDISRHPGSMIARVRPHQDDPKLPILNTDWAYAD